MADEYRLEPIIDAIELAWGNAVPPHVRRNAAVAAGEVVDRHLLLVSDGATPLGAWVRRICERNHVGPSEFSARTGFDRSLLWRWANGERQPSLEALLAVLTSFDDDPLAVPELAEALEAHAATGRGQAMIHPAPPCDPCLSSTPEVRDTSTGIAT